MAPAPRGICAPTRLALALALALGGLLAMSPARAVAAPPRAAPPRAAPPRAPIKESPPPTQANPAERKAVRGSAVDSNEESPELREVRRFEKDAFPRGPDPRASDGDTAPVPPPAGLPGRWGGSGDLPPELRQPAHGPRSGHVAESPAAESLRNLALPDLPVRWEPTVLRFIDYFSKDPRGRAIMGNFLRRMGRYTVAFAAILEREGVPRDLMYLAMIESGFEPRATSNKQAGGVWQFMPGVAKAYGLEVGYWVDARRDPERATEAAGRYLHDLHTRFGSWPLAFAAYHAGYGAILRSITRYNTNDYWELCKHEAGLPWETTMYVPKILAVAIIGHNRAAFGFGDVVSDPPLAYDRVTVPAGTTLAAVAHAAGTRPLVIETLNPELGRSRVPPDRGAGTVRIPVGTAKLYAEAQQHGAHSKTDKSDAVRPHLMRFGESLDDVARETGVSARDLKKLNGLRDASELHGGDTIVVPETTAKSAGVSSAPDDADAAILVAVPERVFSYPDRERVFYRTREGDTLEELAGVFEVALDDVALWNHLDPTAHLHPKMILQVFVTRDFDRAGVALLDEAKLRVVTLGTEEFSVLETARRGKTRLSYTARAGDTLGKIAKRYGLAPGDLARINRLSYSSELTEGQKVVVYSPTPNLPREVTQARRVATSTSTSAAASGGKRAVAGAHPAPRATVAAKSAGKPAVKPTTKVAVRTAASPPKAKR